jgi:hypothetical protein
MVNTHQKKIALLYTVDAVKLQETGRDSKIIGGKMFKNGGGLWKMWPRTFPMTWQHWLHLAF